MSLRKVAMKLIKIEDEYFVLKDSAALTDEEIKKLQSLRKPDVRTLMGREYDAIDAAASRELRKELKNKEPQEPSTQPYKNEAADNKAYLLELKKLAQKLGVQFVFADYKISDNEIPADLRKSGVQIKKVSEIYLVKYDDEAKECYFTDEKGNRTKHDNTRATRDSSGVTLVDKAYGFDKESMDIIRNVYNRLKSIKNKDKLNEAINKLPPKEFALFGTYSRYKQDYADVKQKHYSLAHELQHEKYVRKKAAAGQSPLSMEERYLLLEHDEKAAHLAEAMLAIKLYLKGKIGLNNFPEKCRWLIRDIKKLSPNEQKIKLRDMDYIVNGVLKNWDRSTASAYRGKDKQNDVRLINEAWDTGVLQVKDNPEEYKRQRSLMYSMAVYNPVSGKDEIVDLSQFINPDAYIRDKQKKGCIAQANQIIAKRKGRLKGLTPELIERIEKGTLPAFYDTRPAPQAKGKASPSPQKRIIVEQEIESAPENGDTSAPAAGQDFKEVYRKFYKKQAAKEKSRYEENEQSRNYEGKLIRKSGEELSITATPDSHVSLAAKDKNNKAKIPDYEDFNDLVRLAAQEGKKISFGNIKTPEYKARLLLACLENNVEIKKLPDFDELQGLEEETRKRLSAQKVKLLRRTIAEKEKTGTYGGLNDKQKAEHERAEQAREIIRKARKENKILNNPQYEAARQIIKNRQR